MCFKTSIFLNVSLFPLLPDQSLANPEFVLLVISATFLYIVVTAVRIFWESQKDSVLYSSIYC